MIKNKIYIMDDLCNNIIFNNINVINHSVTDAFCVNLKAMI